MDDVKRMWLDLRSDLRDITAIEPAASPSPHQFDLFNQIVVGKRVYCRLEADENLKTGYSFHWDAPVELEWLTRFYQVQLTLRADSSGHVHGVLVAAITITRANLHPDLTIHSRLPFQVSFGPVIFGELSSGLQNTPVNCRLLRAKATRQSSLSPSPVHFANHTMSTRCWRERARPPLELSSRKLLIPPHRLPAPLRAHTTSSCTYLAMKISSMIGRLRAIPVKAATVSPAGKIDVLVGERRFETNLVDLTSVSPVVAACFQRGSFKESKNLEYIMSAFSEPSVKAFLHFCSHGTVPKGMECVVAELAELSHQYEVNYLLLMCELFLVRELAYCNSIKRLCELARVAVKLELPLLLAAFDVVLLERQRYSLLSSSPLAMKPWIQTLSELSGFEAMRLQSILLLSKLTLSENGEIIRPTCELL